MRFRLQFLLLVPAMLTMTGVLQAEEQQPGTTEVYIPFALHYPALRPDGSLAWNVDGFGKLTNGHQQPVFDTLIGIANPTDQAVNVRFSFFDQHGRPQLWGDGRTYRDYMLQPNCSLATTLIPHNVFPDPPQNFVGYGILQLTNASGSGDGPKLPVYALLGGGGFYPHHWNTFSAAIPVYTSPMPQRRTWSFPYLIPFFEDANHFDNDSYRTGMVITNFGSEAAELELTYRVGDVYPRARAVLSFRKTIPGRQSVSFDLYDELVKAGYPHSMNSEGWLKITSQKPAMVVPYVIHSNRSYDQFSAGQQAVVLEDQ